MAEAKGGAAGECAAQKASGVSRRALDKKPAPLKNIRIFSLFLVEGQKGDREAVNDSGIRTRTGHAL